MKKLISIVTILCSFILLGGCTNMTSNREIRETLEKAFNTAQGNDLFEVGKQVLDEYAPNEESVYIINRFSKGWVDTNDFNGVEKRASIVIVVKYERNQKELKARMGFSNIGDQDPKEVVDLVYRGKGQYYTTDGHLYKPLENIQLYAESVHEVVFTDFKDAKWNKNEGNVYSGKVDNTNVTYLNGTLDKINQILIDKKAETTNSKLTDSKGGIIYFRDKMNSEGLVSERLSIATVNVSIEKNIAISSEITNKKFNSKLMI